MYGFQHLEGAKFTANYSDFSLFDGHVESFYTQIYVICVNQNASNLPTRHPFRRIKKENSDCSAQMKHTQVIPDDPT
jgi:hypothetical protein